MRRNFIFTTLATALVLMGASVAMAATGGPDAYGYTWNDGETYVWNDISSGTLLSLGDEGVSTAINLGFTFVFYGKAYTSVQVAANGHITFNGTTSYTITCDWSGGISQFAGLWTDLNSTSIGAIYYKITGSAPNRKFTAQWTGVPEYNDDTDVGTFQVVLEETTNDIVIYSNEAYQALAASGGVGIKDDSTFLQYACSGAPIAASKAVRFAHPTDFFTLTPAAKTGSGDAGDTVVYTLTVLNFLVDKTTFDITHTGNTWDVTHDATVDVDFGASATFDVSVDIPGDANFGDSDAVTITVANGGDTHDSVLTTQVSCDIFADAGTMVAQLGCSKDAKGPCYMGNVLTSSGANTIYTVKAMFSSNGGITTPSPFRVCFYAATVAGGPTGAPTSCEGPFTADAFDEWYEVVLDTPQEVDGDFAVILDQTGAFLSLGMDDNSAEARGWVSTDDGASFDTTAGIGFPGNFMVRASFCEVIPDDDTVDDDTVDDDTVDDDTVDDDTVDDDTTDDDTVDDDTTDDDVTDDDTTDDDVTDDDTADDDVTDDDAGDDDAGDDDLGDDDTADDDSGDDDDDSGGCGC